MTATVEFDAELPRLIITTILQQLRAQIVPLTTRALAPTHFVVYLHPEDHMQLAGITPAIVADVSRQMDVEIARASKWSAAWWRRAVYRAARPWGPPPLPVEPASARRHIEFLCDPDDELPRGRFRVVVQLPTAAPLDFAGTATMSVTAGVATAVAGSNGHRHRPEPARPYARIDLHDERGARIFEVCSDKTIIGRGGHGVWADVKVAAASEVSQEHVRIRRDPATGDFFIKDLSRNGTSVNGQRLPAGAIYDGEIKREVEGHEMPLPARAEIALADSLTLTFTRLEA
jgi:hypothetical protein